MIDFSDCIECPNTFDGANNKLPVIYNDQQYMLKFTTYLESDPKKPMQASYVNVPISEHLGSSIFKSIGIPTQETLLGFYHDRKVVACKDFISERGHDNFALVEFKKLETSFLGSSSAGGRTPLYENLCNIFANHKQLAPIREAAFKNYWEIYIGDALIGNFDRHAGNWGYILDRGKNQLIETAPVYDCGGSLYPQLSESAMEQLLLDKDAIKERILTFPTSCLMIDGKKVCYHDFLLSEEGEKCREVLLDVFDRIDIHSIKALIQGIFGQSDVQREFFSTLISSRYEQILVPAYEKAVAERNKIISAPKDKGGSAKC